MNTILVVTSDDALRARLMVALGEHSVFTAPNDTEALKTLRLIEIDVVVRGAGTSRDVESFVARVRAIAPAALTITIGVTAEDSETGVSVVETAFGDPFVETGKIALEPIEEIAAINLRRGADCVQ